VVEELYPCELLEAGDDRAGAGADDCSDGHGSVTTIHAVVVTPRA
jgi:hypothetical protein